MIFYSGFAFPAIRCRLLKLFTEPGNKMEIAQNHCFFSFLMSGTVSVCSFSHLNLSSMLLTVVLVIIVQLPPSYQGKIFVPFFLWIRNRIHKRFETKESLTSVMVMTGVDAMAAFLRMKPTFSFFKNSS